MNISIVVEESLPRHGGEFRQHLWKFYVGENSGFIQLTLDEFRSEFRPSRRHKWRLSESWGRLSHIRSTIGKPEVPQHVALEAWDQITKKIRVEGLT